MRNDFKTGYLEHSAKGTTWRKEAAKYLSRVWKNGKWVYTYKDFQKDIGITARKKYKYNQDRANVNAKASQKPEYAKYKSAFYERAKGHRRTEKEAEREYASTPLGKLESTIKKGQNTIAKLLDSLKPQTTITVSSNLMPAGTKKVIKKK